MKKTFCFILLLLVSPFAIAATELYVPAHSVIEKSPTITPKISTTYHLQQGNDPALERAFNTYIRTGNPANIMTEGFVKFAYSTLQQPLVHATPFQETVISLEPGERFTNVSSGDPSRWSYAAAVSGKGLTQQQHVLVKPSFPNTSTNLVITTDKRIYNLKLISTNESKQTRHVSFWYPDEMVIAANNLLSKEREEGVIAKPLVGINNLNFDYRLMCSGWHAPSWKPLRVFDDGVHTYIQFPSTVSNRDLPALFIQEEGQIALVNFRVKAPYFIVDKLFQKAVLILGVGQAQQRITLINRSFN